MKLQFVKLTSQAGDTIVEVLIATAILGLILAGAYATSNRSLNSERDAQEHTQALTIAQSQIESLRSAGSLQSGPAGAVTATCFDASGQPLSFAHCLIASDQSNVVATCPSATPYCYKITDSPVPSSAAILNPANISTSPKVTAITYQVIITWPSITGGQNYTQLYYRTQ
ncbi:MAG: type IV pilus modification PilV family protein [Candidatus Saccharimonadales bacterium]